MGWTCAWLTVASRSKLLVLWVISSQNRLPATPTGNPAGSCNSVPAVGQVPKMSGSRLLGQLKLRFHVQERKAKCTAPFFQSGKCQVPLWCPLRLVWVLDETGLEGCSSIYQGNTNSYLFPCWIGRDSNTTGNMFFFWAKVLTAGGRLS